MNFSEYHEDWKDRIRPDVLKRDKYKCQECGVKHKMYYLIANGRFSVMIEPDEYVEYRMSGVKCMRVYLQVAHLDCNKMNNCRENLKSFCVLCHLRYDKHHRSLMRLAKKKDSYSFGD